MSKIVSKNPGETVFFVLLFDNLLSTNDKFTNFLKMKLRLFNVVILLFIFLHAGWSQDMEMYHRAKDDNLQMPKIPQGMTLNEFQLLSRDIKLMDLAEGLFVPGIVHFKAKENYTGYTLVGIRALSYAGMIKSYYAISDTSLWNGDSSTYSTKVERDAALFYVSLGVAVATYLFDWIHGKYILERKQEEIRYKFSIQIGEQSFIPYSLHSEPVVGLSFKYNF